jgi:hypothetical protein
MDDQFSVQRALDLLNMMAMDPEGIWIVLDDNNSTKVEARLQRLSNLTEAIQKEQDIAKTIQHLTTLASAIQQLVNEIPELSALLLPSGINKVDDLPKLSAWKADLGDTAAAQRAQAQKYAAQIHNHLIIIQQAMPAKRVAGQQPQQSQS